MENFMNNEEALKIADEALAICSALISTNNIDTKTTIKEIGKARQILRNSNLIAKTPEYTIHYNQDIYKVYIDVLVNLFNTDNGYGIHAKVNSYDPVSISFYRKYNLSASIATFTNFITWESSAYYKLPENEYIISYCKMINKINTNIRNNPDDR
jgi:hypothetical protein